MSIKWRIISKVFEFVIKLTIRPKGNSMKSVFTDCYELDEKCYAKYGLTQDILMEHAAAGMANHIRSKFTPLASVLIVAGQGNNGADGIVLARQLSGDYDVKLYVPFGVRSAMAKVQLDRAVKLGIQCVDEVAKTDVLVDALYGAGLNRDLDAKTKHILQQCNTSKAYKIACDLPTGIGSKGAQKDTFYADVTCSMGARTQALYLDCNKDYVGEVLCIDLGIHSQYYEDRCDTQLLEASDIRLPFRDTKDSHKGTYGHAAIFCGEKEGAGVIAGMAATRLGAGLATLVVHGKVMTPPYLMQATVVPSNATAMAIALG